MALDRLEAIISVVSLSAEPASEEEGTVDGGMTW
jgi:hypothetical protein